MNENPQSVIDIRRSYQYTSEGRAKNLELESCYTHTYTFQTDEGYRFVVLIDEFEDINLVGIKFYKSDDYDKKYKYNVLTNHKNPYRFFSTIVCILYNEILKKLPNYAIIAIGEPTMKEIENSDLTNTNAYINTKRIKFYKRLLADLINSGNYEYKGKDEKSVLLLVPNSFTQNMFDNLENFLFSMGFNM